MKDKVVTFSAAFVAGLLIFIMRLGSFSENTNSSGLKYQLFIICVFIYLMTKRHNQVNLEEGKIKISYFTFVWAGFLPVLIAGGIANLLCWTIPLFMNINMIGRIMMGLNIFLSMSIIGIIVSAVWSIYLVYNQNKHIGNNE